mmetsp:Transcript_37466/g.99482  ORF Transcript_37466/g.99482 Transcript_37466/m.99482 type:complete len:147 (+) Transcript_37466:1233-1673(+)
MPPYSRGAPRHASADRPDRRPASERADHERASSYIKPMLLRRQNECAAGAWAKVNKNVPHPLVDNDADRCSIRYDTLDAAKAACCANAKCEVVVRDNGLLCRPQLERHGGEAGPEAPVRAVYELRYGVAHIKHELRRPAQHKLGLD